MLVYNRAMLVWETCGQRCTARVDKGDGAGVHHYHRRDGRHAREEANPALIYEYTARHIERGQEDAGSGHLLRKYGRDYAFDSVPSVWGLEGGVNSGEFSLARSGDLVWLIGYHARRSVTFAVASLPPVLFRVALLLSLLDSRRAIFLSLSSHGAGRRFTFSRVLWFAYSLISG